MLPGAVQGRRLGARGRPGTHRRSAWLAGLAVVVVLSACQTPSPGLRPERLSDLLPQGRSGYLFVRAADNRPLLDRVMTELGVGSAGVQYFLDNTEYAAAALSPDPNGLSIEAVATGTLSKFLVEFGLGRDAAWRREEGPEGLAVFRSGDVAIVAPKDGYVGLFTGDGEELLARLVGGGSPHLPEAVEADVAVRDVVLYLPLSDLRLNVPIQRVLFYLDRRPERADRYELSGQLLAQQDRDPRLLNVFVKLALAGWLRSQGIKDFRETRDELVIDRSGESVTFGGLDLDLGDIGVIVRRAARRP